MPADGSSTTSAGVIAAATLAAKPSAIGVRELLKRLALLGAARVGRKEAGDLASIGSMAAGDAALRTHGRTELAQEQDRRRLAGVVGRLPVPGAVGVGGAEGAFHRGAQHRRVDAPAPFEIRKKMRARP